MTDWVTDWVSGERVFAPPAGTLDPDWLVPAVLESCPGVSPADARLALHRAWEARSDPSVERGEDALDRISTLVVEAAVREFRV